MYTLAVKTLNKHFENKVNVPYVRHLLRKIVQRDKEIVDQFITRLRQQAVYCDFIKQDENIWDHVIEKSKSHRNRVKLIERGKDLPLVHCTSTYNSVDSEVDRTLREPHGL